MDDGASAGVETGTGPRGDYRLVVAGGTAIIAAVLGYLAVLQLVARGSLGSDAELLALPVFGVLGGVGVALFVASFLTR